MILGCFTLLLFFVGLCLWGGSVAAFLFGQEITLIDIFCLLLGGQLIKLAYSFWDSEDVDRKYNAIIKKIEDKL